MDQTHTKNHVKDTPNQLNQSIRHIFRDAKRGLYDKMPFLIERRCIFNYE